MNRDTMRTIRSATALEGQRLRLEWSDGTVAEVAMPQVPDLAAVELGDWGHSLVWPDGTEIGWPVSLTGMPRVRPSVPAMATGISLTPGTLTPSSNDGAVLLDDFSSSAPASIHSFYSAPVSVSPAATTASCTRRPYIPVPPNFGSKAGWTDRKSTV